MTKKVKTSVDFDKLREELPSGYAPLLSQKFNCSLSKVWKVAAGVRTDWRMLQALIELAKKTKGIKEQSKKEASKL